MYINGSDVLSNRLKKKESLTVLEVIITLTKKKEWKNKMAEGFNSLLLICNMWKILCIYEGRI